MEWSSNSKSGVATDSVMVLSVPLVKLKGGWPTGEQGEFAMRSFIKEARRQRCWFINSPRNIRKTL